MLEGSSSAANVMPGNAAQIHNIRPFPWRERRKTVGHMVAQVGPSIEVEACTQLQQEELIQPELDKKQPLAGTLPSRCYLCPVIFVCGYGTDSFVR